MVKDIILPDLGEGIEGAEVSEVSVAAGDTVNPDDTILVLESDKASMEIPAEVTGTVKEVLVTAGNELKTGQLLMKIEIVEELNEKEEHKPPEKEKEDKDLLVRGNDFTTYYNRTDRLDTWSNESKRDDSSTPA